MPNDGIVHIGVFLKREIGLKLDTIVEETKCGTPLTPEQNAKIAEIVVKDGLEAANAHAATFKQPKIIRAHSAMLSHLNREPSKEYERPREFTRAFVAHALIGIGLLALEIFDNGPLPTREEIAEIQERLRIKRASEPPPEKTTKEAYAEYKDQQKAEKLAGIERFKRIEALNGRQNWRFEEQRDHLSYRKHLGKISITPEEILDQALHYAMTERPEDLARCSDPTADPRKFPKLRPVRGTHTGIEVSAMPDTRTQEQLISDILAEKHQREEKRHQELMERDRLRAAQPAPATPKPNGVHAPEQDQSEQEQRPKYVTDVLDKVSAAFAEKGESLRGPHITEAAAQHRKEREELHAKLKAERAEYDRTVNNWSEASDEETVIAFEYENKHNLDSMTEKEKYNRFKKFEREPGLLKQKEHDFMLYYEAKNKKPVKVKLTPKKKGKRK